MLKFFKGPSYWQYSLWVLFAGFAILPVHAQQIPSVSNQQKLSPALRTDNITSTPRTVRVQVKDKAAFLKWMSGQPVKATLTSVTGKENVLLVSDLNELSWQKLLQNPWVSFIDRPNRKAIEETELNDTDFTINKVYALHGKYASLNGQGLAASVKEGAYDPNDIDLKGRTIEPTKNGSSFSIHATTMATIIAGGGNSGPNGKGVAHRARLAYSDFAELLPDNSLELLAKGISVQNHSYGVGLENYYGIESAAYDKEVFENPQLLHVFSSGNSGDKTNTTGNYASIAGVANLTGQFKTSKNTISVGALDPDGNVGRLSSKGPAYDGRVKPEVVAHGIGGTSEAAAVVSGIALLVQQAYAEDHGGMLPPASLVKAALINSADDIGRPGVDFDAGFGNTDALGAVRSMKSNTFFTGSVAQGQEKKFAIPVPEKTGMLKVTIVWHEAEASPTSQTALLNDLDLTLRHTATGEIWRPWVLSSFPHPDSLKLPAKRGIDRLNNVEQVTVESPASGNYELLVNGFRVLEGSQEFSLVYETESGTEWLYPAAGSALHAATPYNLNWQTSQQAGAVRLEYKYSSDQNWKTVAGTLDISSKSYTWTTPDTAAIMQLRLVTDSGVIASDEFIVSKFLKLKVGFYCDDQVMVHWRGMPNAQQYQLLQMGTAFLEPLLTTADTLAVISRTSLQSINNELAVAPVIQNKIGQSSNTIATDQAGVACYIRSFLPTQLVMNQVGFKLEISTLYELAAITLERQAENGYQGINTLPPSDLTYNMSDPEPLAGRNVYRIKLTTETGKTYYSQSEEIVYAHNNYLQAYPNPVVSGNDLSIVVASPSAKVQLFDRLGRLLSETTEDGVIKSISTGKLPKGLYILRVLTEEGLYLSTRVVII